MSIKTRVIASKWRGGRFRVYRRFRTGVWNG